MNIGALQSMLGVAPQQTKASALGNANQGSQTFGSVFAWATSTASDDLLNQQTDVNSQLDIIQSLFHVTDLSSLKEMVRELGGTEITNLDTNGVEVALGTLKEFADKLSLEADSLVENLKTLLKESGLSDEKLEQLDDQTPLWTLIGFVDEVAPRFFTNLTESLSKQSSTMDTNSSLHVLTLLKAFEIAAPKTDMVLSQEQRLASLQFSMTQAGSRFDDNVAKQPNGKVDMLQGLQKVQPFHIMMETSQGDQAKEQANSQAKSEQSISVTQQGVQPSVHKSDIVSIQTGQTQENRSETLMKEMQLLFKRANFGQVGGSNRILIKLYPEHLGQIRIELHETNGIISARILASTALAKEMLDSQMHQLRHAFNQQNVQVDRIDITQSVQEPAKEREQAFNEQFKREQQGEESKKEQTAEAETTFEEYLIELEV
ncbi:flagellar hook-length control protein FliK [Sporosarcina sp. Te-1]|uniref:flagellar hook-length control protein FliK n=1 Tax=Sporosarcina sp. Te-1 TaxID=2818390 RepID=UPI001A9F4AFB|nr:flagellar hook-length control protein FliK [Sporosarcina sp. Te-1]QTD42325.1 flagellar hook-length control protein FliK [Sporosarcina sp. Te-1]